MDDNPYRGLSSDSGESPQTRRVLSRALKVLAVIGVLGLVVALLLPVRRHSGEAARRNGCTNQLKQIGLALRLYEQVHHALPPAYTVDADGKPLHSWRTLILPYLEQVQLYKTIDLTKPWDDPVNARAFEACVDAYQCPSASIPVNCTTYLAVVAPGSCLRPAEPRQLADITDSVRETLMVMEVDPEHAVPWMSPTDADESLVLGIGPASQLAHVVGINAAFVDGHVRFLFADTPAVQRRALISIAGGETVADDAY